MQYIRLGDIASIAAGQGAPQGAENYSEYGTPFVKAGNLAELTSGTSEDAIQKVSDEVAAKHKLKLFPQGTVLFAKSGMSCMKGYVYTLSRDCYVVSHLACITPHTVESEYLKYYFEFHRPNQLVKDAAYPSISLSDIAELPIAVFDQEKRQEIIHNLDVVSGLIEKKQQILSLMDLAVKSRFIELFGDLHSTKFPKCKMAEICNIKHGYAFSGEFFTEEDNNILLVTPGNFKVGGGFQEKKCKFFMGEYSEEYVLNCGDLIVTMTDLSKNMDTLGYSAIVPSTNRVYLHNQRIGLFVDMSENINKVFLMYFMQTNEYRDSIITSATGSTVHHTSPSKILDCDIFLPPIELQDQFAAFVEQTDKSKLAVQQGLEKLETLKKALMQKYFG